MEESGGGCGEFWFELLIYFPFYEFFKFFEYIV